jgi:haloacetate dehalogenase
MFEGFVDERVDVGAVELRVRHAGSGPPILLVHGHPRTGATWHRVAPRLVEAGFSVVCPDMRGYGQSGKAEVLPDHSQQSKRTVALDLVRLMERLGHGRFAAVGHDRGCYVAFRAAMDHPDVVTRLVVMDGVPISEALERCDARFAHDWYHWFFFAQPDKPERAILADPDSWYDGDPGRLGEENHREFREATHDPATVVAMLEDYRAGLGIDRQHEMDDRRNGRTVRCPTLFLHSTRDDMEDLYGDPLAIWRPWVDDLRGGTIESGHHMAEENPEDLSEALVRFLSNSDPSSFDAADYAGLSFDEAKVLATGAGWDVRRLTADMVITLEFRHGRLNLTVDHQDVVVAAHLG